MFRYGDKVYPISKLGSKTKLNESVAWALAKQKGQNYLYVNRYDGNKVVCGIKFNYFDLLGECFFEEDLIHYNKMNDEHDDYINIKAYKFAELVSKGFIDGSIEIYVKVK